MASVSSSKAASIPPHDPGGQGGPRDRALLLRIVDGDDIALVALFDAYRARAFGVALRVLRDPCEAEDAVQETFIQIWTRPHSYDPARGEVSVWISLIARSRALDRLRRRRPPRAAVGETASAPPHIVENLVMKEALEGLSAPQRKVIELSYYEGLTQTEIAHRLSLPLGTVKGRARSGMIRLREALDSAFR